MKISTAPKKMTKAAKAAAKVTQASQAVKAAKKLAKERAKKRAEELAKAAEAVYREVVAASKLLDDAFNALKRRRNAGEAVDAADIDILEDAFNAAKVVYGSAIAAKKFAMDDTRAVDRYKYIADNFAVVADAVADAVADTATTDTDANSKFVALHVVAVAIQAVRVAVNVSEVTLHAARLAVRYATEALHNHICSPFAIGIASTPKPGLSWSNQDSALCSFWTVDDEQGSSIRLSCVTDGHGDIGHKASQLVLDNIMRLFWESVRKFYDSSNTHVLTWDMKVVVADLVEGLHQIFVSDSENFQMSGCTLAVAIIVHSGSVTRCTTATVGDSWIKVVKEEDGSLMHESHPLLHTPSAEEERKRIEATVRGYVSSTCSRRIPRLNGMLALSRALGDIFFRECGLSSKPEIQEFDLSGSTVKYIVLCTDGMDAVVISDILKKTKKEDVSDIAERLVTEATNGFNKGLAQVDDATAVVIRLPL